MADQQVLVYIAIIFLTPILWAFTSPLRSIPGPFLAKFTNLWRLVDVYRGSPHLTHIQLHRRYGSAVRLGPNFVSLSDPSLIKTIYSTRNGFRKSGFYRVNDFINRDGRRQESIFSTQSVKFHAAEKKPLLKHYSMTSLLNLEKHIDQTVTSFMEKLEGAFIHGSNDGRVCDLGKWFLYFSLDSAAHLTFSKPMGFIEKGADISNLIRNMEKGLDYFAVIGQIPVLDHLLDKNPVSHIGPPSINYVTDFSAGEVLKRMDDAQKGVRQIDMLDALLEKLKIDTDSFDFGRILTSVVTNIVAGTHTVASSLASLFYHVLKNPQVLRELQKELDEANFETPVSFKDVQSLPYLEAAVREIFRIQPAIGLALERVVSDSGLTLPDGRFLPAGTIVGMNAHVLHRNEEIFGPNPDEFVPERWLKQNGEDSNGFQARLAAMNNSDLTFGFGSRSCLGKNIALLEIYKLAASLLLEYEINLVNPEKNWKVQNSWFLRQTGIDVTFKRRG